MIVNVKLKFDDSKDLKMLIELLWKLGCPLIDAKCVACRYHRSCLKLREITRRLEIAETYESKGLNNEE